MHGGATPNGVALPQFVAGRQSKNLPSRLAVRYQESLADSDLLALRSEMALTDARLDDLLGRVDTGEAGETWKSLRLTFAAGAKALLTWNEKRGTVDGEKAKDDFFLAWETVGILIAEGAQDYQAWDEVHKMVEQRRRLAETETKRLEKMGQMITADRAMNLIGAMLGLVRENVTDRNVLSKIAAGLDRLAAEADGAGVTT